MFKEHDSFTLISKEELKDVASIGYMLEHKKTGARVALIETEDDNKAFMIGFKTPQSDSTGVPHILEHSVLCGSKRFPVKDAMTEVSKGSLNTFLNAFTYPDRTLYPVASVNDKDFNNLMRVYLDAVFAPRVLSEEKIFMQEGWHYEMEDIDSPITYNGVVYNEMKGVYSSPESALESYILFSLFPDTQYGVESGGDPDVIPSLSYEEFCAFYKKLYHPSNSRIYLYGDMDFYEKLDYIDKEYLSKYERINPDSEVKIQKPFTERKRIEKEYSVSSPEEEKDATFLSYNVVCSDYLDAQTTEVMNAINYALCSVPGAKLKQRLLDAGIGKDVYSEMTTDTCQKIFSIIAQDANAEDEEKFVSIIEDTLNEIIKEGFDKKALEASITSSEFSYREADYGYYPKGVAYGTLTFEKWLYSDDDIFTNLKLNNLYKVLREGLDNGLFESTLKERILDNNHKTILVMKPKCGLMQEKEEELKSKLLAYRDTLSNEELESIVEKTKELKAYQEEEDSDEALATIPTLSISDIKKEVRNVSYEVLDIDGIKEVYTDIKSNGIAYFTIGFNADTVPKRLIPAMSIAKVLMGSLNTKSYSYGDLINEVNIKSGGLTTSAILYKSRTDTDEYILNFEERGKALYSSIDDTFELIKEILFTSDFDDKKRVKEILEQTKVRIQGYMMSSGHMVAIGRAGSSISDSNELQEKLTGMEQFRNIERILDNYDEEYPVLVRDIKEVLSIVLNKNNLEINLGAEPEGKTIFNNALKSFISELDASDIMLSKEHIKSVTGNEAFSCSSLVQYAAVCGNYVKNGGLKYTGSIQVLRSILSTDYLWTTVRLQGGAYGCMCVFFQNGDSAIVSYRDPNLKKTYDTYKKVYDYVKDFDADNEEVERYIISTIGEYDTPMTPSMLAARSFTYYKSGITNEDKQKERDEILATDVDKIRTLAPYIKAVLDTGSYSCVGGEDILKSEGDMFDKITPLV